MAKKKKIDNVTFQLIEACITAEHFLYSIGVDQEFKNAIDKTDISVEFWQAYADTREDITKALKLAGVNTTRNLK